VRQFNYFGKSNWNRDALFDGALDDIKIFCRGLTQNEIQIEMNTKRPLVSQSNPVDVGTLPNGLIHYWPVNGSGIDDIGYMDMTLETNAQLSTDRVGRPNGAICFSKGFASVPPGVYFDPATSGFTFMAWIQVASFAFYERIFDFGLGQQNENVLLTLRATSAFLRLDTYNGNRENNGEFSSPIEQNVWRHVAVSVTGSVSTFYIDGIQRGSGSG